MSQLRAASRGRTNQKTANAPLGPNKLLLADRARGVYACFLVLFARTDALMTVSSGSTPPDRSSPKANSISA